MRRTGPGSWSTGSRVNPMGISYSLSVKIKLPKHLLSPYWKLCLNASLCVFNSSPPFVIPSLCWQNEILVKTGVGPWNSSINVECPGWTAIVSDPILLGMGEAAILGRCFLRDAHALTKFRADILKKCLEISEWGNRLPATPGVCGHKGDLPSTLPPTSLLGCSEYHV